MSAEWHKNNPHDSDLINGLTAVKHWPDFYVPTSRIDMLIKAGLVDQVVAYELTENGKRLLEKLEHSVNTAWSSSCDREFYE